jgi:hypothetical protein
VGCVEVKMKHIIYLFVGSTITNLSKLSTLDNKHLKDQMSNIANPDKTALDM